LRMGPSSHITYYGPYSTSLPLPMHPNLTLTRLVFDELDFL
jgi:hypothetical protein